MFVKFQKQDLALDSGEGLSGIKEETVSLVDDFAGVNKLKKKTSMKEQKKKGLIPLPAADLQFCLSKTNLDKPKISQWFR